MVKWKRIATKEHIKAVEPALNLHLSRSFGAKELKDDFATAHNHYVFATHKEIADALNIDENTPGYEPRWPLLHLMGIRAGKNSFAPVIPADIQDDYFFAGFEDVGQVVVVRDSVLEL